MQGNLELEMVSGSGVGHNTPAFEALSERSNYRKDSQSTVAGSPTSSLRQSHASAYPMSRHCHIEYHNQLFCLCGHPGGGGGGVSEIQTSLDVSAL